MSPRALRFFEKEYLTKSRREVGAFDVLAVIQQRSLPNSPVGRLIALIPVANNDDFSDQLSGIGQILVPPW